MAYPRLGGCGAWEMDGSVSAGTAAFYGPYKHPEDTFDETVPLEDLRVEQVFMAGKTMNSPSLTPLKLLVRLIFSRRRKI